MQDNVCLIGQQAGASTPLAGLAEGRLLVATPLDHQMPGLMTKQNMLTFTDQSVLKPHLLVAMIDDLGWSGVGSDFSSKLQNGDKISPKLRALAFDGLRLERHYTYKFCSPSRSSFFSGRLPHRVNQVNLPPEAPGGGVPVEMRTIADILRHQGYRTILVSAVLIEPCTCAKGRPHIARRCHRRASGTWAWFLTGSCP